MTPADSKPFESRAARYWCFISYRHADNKEAGRQWATWLHQSEETRAKLTQARDIWLELRKTSPLTPPQETSLAEIEKLLSKP